MKRLLLTLVVLLSLPVLAQESRTILLQPGTMTNIDGITISCAGATNQNLPKCAIYPASDGFGVSVGGNTWGSSKDFQGAVNVVIQLKASGICQ